MDVNELTKQYFKYVKICGLSIGSWPFQTGWTKYLFQGFLYSMVISAFFTQMSRVVLFYSFNVLAEQIPFLGVAVIGLTKYLNYIANNLRFQQILSSLSMDWKSLHSNIERDIMQMYVRRAVLFSFFYKLNVYFACVTFGGLPFIPLVSDILKPLNESRPRVLVYPAHYYVDEAQYYYYLLFHTLICMGTAAMILLFSDCVFIYLVQHACALVSVAGYRFKHAADDTHYSSSKKLYSKDDAMLKELRDAVECYNRAIVLINDLESIYAVNLFVQVGIAVTVLSMTLLVIAQTNFSSDMYAVYGFILVQVIHLLFLTIQGQFVCDTFEEVYSEIYGALWYQAHPKFQLFYALTLRRNLTFPVLTAGGLIRLDLNSFSEMLKASVSYYTVLRSN